MSTRRMRKRLGSHGVCAFLFVSLALLPFALPAQNPRGTLRGVVQDASGGRVPSAKITVQASETKLQRELTSDSRGEFRIDDIVRGTYPVNVHANGLAQPHSTLQINDI